MVGSTVSTCFGFCTVFDLFGLTSTSSKTCSKTSSTTSSGTASTTLTLDVAFAFALLFGFTSSTTYG
ncbi:MAG: hypothetical protein ACKPKO_58180 [Candidatus Fonsibacter sp.]